MVRPDGTYLPPTHIYYRLIYGRPKSFLEWQNIDKEISISMYDFRIEFMFQFENREEPELEAEIANCKNGVILENG